MTDVSEKLLKPLLAVYGEPRTAHPEIWLAEFEDVLRGFDADELAWAKGFLMRNHRVAICPTPAECLAACEEARRQLSPEWAMRMRSRILAAETEEELDELWSSHVRPKKETVSRHSYELLKDVANSHWSEMKRKAKTAWMN